MCIIKQIVPLNYDVFCGMDTDKRSISAAIVEHNGQMRTMQMPSNGRNLVRYINNHYPGKRVAYAYEAGPTGYKLYDYITAEGNDCLVVSASNIPSTLGQRVKTNRLDAQKIAENLRGGQLHGINVPDEIYRNLRHLTQLRETLVKQSSATKNRIKSLLTFEGIDFPVTETSNSANNWSKAIIEKLKELECNPVVRFKLSQHLMTLTYCKFQILETSKAIRNYYKNQDELNRNFKYVTSIPGIGKTTAIELVARIGDWRYLERPTQIGSFLGLVPKEYSTGDTQNRGSITKTGNGRLRNKLIQCSWTAIKHDKELADFYQKVVQRNSPAYAKKVAIVAVARKLTMRIFAVLKEQREYTKEHSPRYLGNKDKTLPEGRLVFATDKTIVL